MDESSEKDQMLAGEFYLASAPELAAERKRARRLTRLDNATTEDEEERRSSVSCSGGWAPGPRSSPRAGATRGGISIGEGFYANFGCVILDCNVVAIGRDVKFGPSVHLYVATHPIDPVARTSGRELGFPVTIGDGVCVGGGSLILPGVTIGEGSTIAAGSVVARSIPPRTVAAGVPCRVVKSLDEPGPEDRS